MLLEVRQIREVEVRNNNKVVPDPRKSGSNLKEEEIIFEAIDVGRIKASREFKKGGPGGKHHKYFEDGEKITVLYLYPESEEKRSIEMHILYEYKQFLIDVNALKSGREIQTTGS